MSVINQMLKDLENRNNEHPSAPENAVLSSTRASSKKIPVLALLLIVIIAGLALFIWQLYQENQSLKNTVKVPVIENNNKTLIENDGQVTETNQQVSKSAAQQKSTNAFTGDNSAESAGVAKNTEKNQIDVDNISKLKTIEQSGPQPDDERIVNAQLQAQPAKQQPQSSKQKPTPSTKSMPIDDRSLSLPAEMPKTPRLSAVKAMAEKPSMAISRRQLTPDEFTKQKMQQAEQAIENNEIAQAEAIFEEVLLVQPENKNARKQLAALWFGRQAYQPAINLLSQGIALDPQNSEFRLMKARLYLAQGNANQAYQVLSALPATLDTEYQLTLANAAQQTGNFSGAINAYQVLVQLQPQNGRWWLGLAIAYDSDGQFKKASQAYQSALAQGGLSDASTEFAQQRMLELGE